MKKKEFVIIFLFFFFFYFIKTSLDMKNIVSIENKTSFVASLKPIILIKCKPECDYANRGHYIRRENGRNSAKKPEQISVHVKKISNNILKIGDEKVILLGIFGENKESRAVFLCDDHLFLPKDGDIICDKLKITKIEDNSVVVQYNSGNYTLTVLSGN